MAAPSIVGTRLTQVNSNSVNALLPAGTAAGDRLVLIVGGGYEPSGTPSGCTEIDTNYPQTYFNGATWTKIATAGDISTGYITVGFAGSYKHSALVIALPSGCGVGVVDSMCSPYAGPNPNDDTIQLTGDMRAIYVAMSRNTTQTTISRGGTALETSATEPATIAKTEAGALAASTVTYTGAANSGRYELTLVTYAEAVGSYPTAVLADGPWGLWRMADAFSPVLDYSGHGRAARVVGSPTYGQAGPRGDEGAISWPANYGVSATTGVLFNPGAAGWTYEAWVKLTATPTEQITLLAAAQSDAGTTNCETVLAIDSTGKATAGQWNSGWTYLTAGSALSLDTWHHLVARNSLAGDFRLYVDGAQVASATKTPSSTSRLMRVRGGHAAGSSAALVSCAAVYSAALSGTRIADHYAAMSATDGPSVRWWDGSAEQPATVLGWWDGSAVQPATVRGWWDGTDIQPLA